MNFTFMIGNGFDINLGLKTKYSDFYSYITKKYPALNNIFFDRIKENVEYWEDFEKMLGLLTCYSTDKEKVMRSISYNTNYGFAKSELEEIAKNIVGESSDKEVTKKHFFEDLRFFFNEFKRYLTLQESIFAESISEKSKYTINNSLSTFFEDFEEENQRIFFARLARNLSGLQHQNKVNSIKSPFELKFIFLNFNYTSTLNRLLKEVNLETLNASWQEIIRKKLKIEINVKITFEEIHVHAKKTSGMFFGVDALEQLNPSFFANVNEVDRIIKPFKIEEYGSGNLEKYTQILKSSDYIYIYGMSLGVTDLTWWKLLIEIINNFHAKIIIHYFEKDFTIDVGSFEYVENKDKIKSLLLNYDEEYSESVNRGIRMKKKNRIIPIANSDVMFKI